MRTSKLENVDLVKEAVAPEVEAVAPEVEAVAPEVEPEAQDNLLRAVYGRMIDPFTNVEYSQESTVPATGSSWEQCQIEAGKLAVEACPAD